MRVTKWLRGLMPAIALRRAAVGAARRASWSSTARVQEEWCRPMVAAFEKATGIKVLMTRKSSGEFYAQLKAEAANPRGDIWWGGTGDPHLQAAEEGLTEAVQVAEDGRAAGLGDPAVRKRRRAAPIGIYAGALGYSYNTDQLKKKSIPEPKCWSDLTKPQFKDEIQVANPNSSGTSYTMLATFVQLMGEDKAFELHEGACTRTSTSTRSPAPRPRARRPPARAWSASRSSTTRCVQARRRRAGQDRVAVRRHRLRDRQHEHHQGREEHGERQEVVRLGARRGGAGDRRGNRR